ncbi:hypothetical protein AB0C59_07200 [Streptomyces sp. NPDC048664]|uniref:hypothetical protein n=1 Tax=Streptomyces sp. NPDC048664 TaxID=3154505 RepID=UPI00344421D9
MSTGVIIVLALVVVAALAGAAALSPRARGAFGQGGLKRRFGPEYERAVRRHDGDTKAAERELAERVRLYGSLESRPLEAADRERFAARWAAAQELFVESPGAAMTEADRLLAEVAGARGLPDGTRYEEQVDALSVHHATHVHAYRRLHRAAHVPAGGAGDGSGTEELREALLQARALFEELTAPGRRASKSMSRTAGHTVTRRRRPGALHRPQMKGN